MEPLSATNVEHDLRPGVRDIPGAGGMAAPMVELGCWSTWRLGAGIFCGWPEITRRVSIGPTGRIGIVTMGIRIEHVNVKWFPIYHGASCYFDPQVVRDSSSQSCQSSTYESYAKRVAHPSRPSSLYWGLLVHGKRLPQTDHAPEAVAPEADGVDRRWIPLADVNKD